MFERICTDCKKVEMVKTKGQLARKCRSCSKKGNTSSQNLSVEAREKMAAAKRGTTPWNKGRTDIYSEETRALMGADKVGKPRSEDAKQKTSDSLKATYAKRGSKLSGRTLSAQHKERISDSLEQFKTFRTITTLGEVRAACVKDGIILAEDAPPETPVGMHDFLNFVCSCGNSFVRKYQTFDRGFARACRECNNTSSQPERELIDFLVNSDVPEAGIIQHHPMGTGRLEYDIYLPKFDVAIEYHGLAYHSERPIYKPKDISKTKKRHEEKYLLAKKSGTKLIQIFEDEWLEKPEIIKSIIMNKLGKADRRIAARQCSIVHRPAGADTFFAANHISGAISNARMSWGLEFEGHLVACLSLRSTWNKKHGEVLEIARFATTLNTSVAGGFSRLLKQAVEWAKSQGFHKILTYADCRFGSGGVYLGCGFKHVGKTKPNYFYERDMTREQRFKHRKVQGPGSERSQQNALGWYAIYDAGSEIYVLDF